MKGKIQSSKNKKMIALAAAVIVLLAGTVTGVSLFLKDDGSASATEFGNEQQGSPVEQTSENNPSEQNPEQLPGDEQTNPGEQVDGEGENGTTNPGTTGGDQTTQTGTGTTNQGTTGTAQLPQESISYRDRLVSEDFLVGWTPIGISAITNTMGRYINSPKLQIEKISYTETDFTVDGGMLLPEETKYTAVQPGEMVIYEIRVTNIGNADAKDIKILDKIPEGTTVIEIGSDGVQRDGNVEWISDIPAQKQVSFKFAVTINEEVKGSIKNVAVVNGDKTNETKNAVLETLKTATVTRNGQTVEQEARPGDVITYTIKVTNTGDVRTTTKVVDILPADTTLVEESINENGKEEERIITWDEVAVDANETVELKFQVTVNETVKDAIRNVATVGSTETNETENHVSNIIAHKTVDKEEAKVGDTLIYTITLSNSGNVAGTVTVSDKIPAGTTIADATVEGYNANTNTMTWSDVVVEAGAEVELTLEVVIDVDTTTSVVNTAVLDGEEIEDRPETKVANITGTKTVNKEEAKVGDTLIYTITLSNSGNVAGTVTVSDKIPAGTTIADATVEGYNIETNTMTWSNVVVEAGAEVELTLEVVINEDTKTSVINTAVLDEEEIEDKPETKVANITAVKESIADEPLKEKGKITYYIKLHNDGNVAGKVTVTDEVPEGTTLVSNSVKIDGTSRNNIAINGRNITWAEVTVGTEADVVLSFEVTVDVFTGETKQIVNNKATLDGKPVNTTTDEAEKAYREILVNKVWEDNSNVAEKRPESIYLQLKANEVEQGDSVRLSGIENTWSYTFTRLPKYDANGNEITYTVEEQEVEEGELYFYEASVPTGDMENGYTITNKFNVPYVPVSVLVNKVWADNNDVAEKRPDSIYLQLKANEEDEGNPVTLSGTGNTWSYTFTELAKYDANGDEIAYTVEEQEVEEGDLYFYETSEPTGDMDRGYTITNKFNVPYVPVSVSVNKVWDDNSNVAEKRPESIYLQLKANEVEQGDPVRLSGIENTWSYTFTNLAKYDANGDEITYTVEEQEVEEGDLYFYEASEPTGDMENGYTITNKFNVPYVPVSVSVNKVWEDNNNTAGKRPDNIYLQLKANEEDEGNPVRLSGTGNTWSYTFTELAKYDANGDEITYTVEEQEVKEGDLYFYEASAPTGDIENGYTITNKFNVPYVPVSIPVQKVWVDTAEQQDKRPNTIKVQVKVANEVAREVTIGTETEYGWSYTFSDLPKYDTQGNIINYSVDEVEVVEGDLYFYQKSIEPNKDDAGNILDGFTITNEFAVPSEKVSIPVEKVWEDTVAQQDKRPLAITLQVKNGNGNVVDSYTVTSREEWKHTFSLDKYDSNGNPISYTVDEAEVVEGDLYFYQKSIEQNKDDAGNIIDGFTITNTFEVPTDTVDITINKVWEDTVAQSAHRPASITLQVKNGDTVVASIERTVETGWSYTFENLPKYDENGDEITYTAGEVMNSKFYTVSVSGQTVTNTFTRPTDTVNVTINKAWVDTTAQSAHRPASITLQVKNGNTIVNSIERTAETGWSYTFENLPKYDENGNEIIYTAGEVMESKFYTANVSGQTVTNTFTRPTDTVDVTINKVWEDTVAQSAHRPASITLQVKNGDTVVASIERTATTGWSYTFENLPKYDENGNEITYTAGEVIESKFYTASVSGQTVTNKFTRPTDTVDVTINKVWVDTAAQSAHRPASIILQVKNGNTVVNSIERTAETGWSYTFENLPKYDENGNEITYTAGEVIESKFYTASVSGQTVTNTFTRPTDTIDIPITKTWVYPEGTSASKPSSIKVKVVKQDGTPVEGKEAILSGEGNTWSTTITGLPKYDNNGNEITYTVDEVEINAGDLENYSKRVSGYDITNTYTPPVLNVTKSSTTPSPVKAGDTISYTITVTNTGGGIARNVTVRDDLDLSKVSFISASDGGTLNGSQVVWTIDSLVAKTGSKTVTLTVKVNDTAKLGATISNIATVDGGQKASDPVNHKVETTIDTLQQSETVTGTNVVIVLDLSSSMRFSITGPNGEATTRLASAQKAAADFINKVFPKGIATGNQISVVTFNYRDASDQNKWTPSIETAEKYKGTKVFTFGEENKTIATGEDDAASLISGINNITLGDALGTNIKAALDVTKTQVEVLKAAKPENKNVVVFLGDGAPSPYRTGKGEDSVESVFAGNVESEIVRVANEIKAIQNVPADSSIAPSNTVIHTIGFGVTQTDTYSYTQCCTNSSKHSKHNHIYTGKNPKTYTQDTYGYYYTYESDATIATRILSRMSSGEGYYHLSDNGAGLIKNFNAIFKDVSTNTGSKATVNGIATIVLETKLDTSKPVILTINGGTPQEVAYSDFAANGLSYIEVGTTYTLTWDVTKYDANTTLHITYNTL